MMFSPKVLYALPRAERTLMTLLVRGTPVCVGVGSCAATMNCSFKTSWKVSGGRPSQEGPWTHQYSDRRIMVWIVNVVGDLLDNLEQHLDKFILHICCTQIVTISNRA